MGVSDSESRATIYVVLSSKPSVSGGAWIVAEQNVMAASADAALKSVAKESGTYVAVPARSWKPMRVEQVQTVQTVITAADETPEPDPVDKIQPGPLEDTAS